MELPFISVIIAARNEARFIGPCLDSILASDYPAERMEILVADGMSEDETRELALRRAPRVRVIRNAARSTPCGLNLAIERARGEIIVRVDAHATVARDYLAGCLRWLEETG